ncbi:amidase [Pseudomonas sp. 5Ae-yellow]|uniref:amidase n=1 Tax=Pseudomonas sp. 5Ae-yellow TaxID=2759848 RepID=UPI0015F446D5|nr:amidase [Pseudomonas sp. 5Ae-yellow]MBA6420981.1 amidase [Pseudomonas sp. 5Ae-yellow]
MSSSELHYLEAYELSLLIRSRRVSPVEITEAMLARIGQLDGDLHSYASVTAELAMDQAREAEQELMRGQCRSPLHGIPIAYKDLFCTAGVPTAGGMPIRSQFVPQEDATVVARLRDAGAVMLGKLQMTEGAFAIHHPESTPPNNPWNAGHWTGASSSGCGVATAAGLCYASLGSDTGGSIRFPCAANGLTGLKPTWGRVSRYGALELAASLDHIGPITRSARDALFMLSTIAGHDPRDPTSSPSVCLEIPGIEDSFRGLRVGIDEAWLTEGVDPVIQEALQQVMAVIRDGGGLLQVVRVPDTRAVSANWEAHCGVQAAVAHADTYPQHAPQYGPALSRLIDGGRALSGMDYQHILLDAQCFTGKMDALFKDLDLLLAPVQPYAAPTHEQLANLAQDAEANRRLIQFTSPFNISGHPCISLPCGFAESGLPIGCQFIAGKGEEGVLCRAGMALQQVTDWHRARPFA